MRITKKQDRLPGIILTILLFVAEIAFTVLLLYTNLLSAKYVAIVFAVQLVLLLVVYLLVRKFRKQIRFWIGVILMIVILAILGIAGFYIYKTVSTLDDITGVNKEITEINVYVKQDDAAQTLLDASGYSFGILSDLDRNNTDTALQQMSYETGSEAALKEYNSLTELADGLLKGDCQAIVLNRAYLDVLDQMDNYSTFSSQIRQIASEQVETLIERNTPAPVNTTTTTDTTVNTSKDVAVTDQVYTIYISGIDTRGAMTSSSLSDVNIILTVNPQTKQVLMISTPRDYYVPLSISNGVPDKLTHAGIYGVNVCMDTLDMLYDIDINYYFRLNFAGFIKIIDALGGITIDSDYDFTSKNVEGFHFNKGSNQVNGEQALAFCRERYSFAEGDRQRGRNQMAVIQGVLNKITSPDLLKNYLSLLNSLSGCFETNVPYDVITSLVKQQLDDGGSWQVLSYSADGTGDSQKPYSMSQKAYVMVPDQTTVDKAKTLMQKVREGFVLSEADVAAQ
ncbi:LCP family protein [Blautia sp. MSJ-19]|uniref:LCP family protein n=1 Tax=Blautia sp. MSJ-19 TaxID=2841517 RepID=UPI001C0F2155|nr:LCP family protein [Blautia sp. MSJ-19]MBU5481905.1 LCP family protein [Blautia sp. MSJ-19]